MIQRYTTTRNPDGLGFSNGISLDSDGEFVAYSEYEKLERAYNALAEEMTAAQGQIAEAQQYLEWVKTDRMYIIGTSDGFNLAKAIALDIARDPAAHQLVEYPDGFDYCKGIVAAIEQM
jgi:hypothetical protein